MTDDQLIRTLRSIGMGCFVTHLSMFRNPSLSHAEVAEHLSAFYTAKAAYSRTVHSRRILEAGRLNDALELIQSARVDQEIRDAARALLKA